MRRMLAIIPLLLILGCSWHRASMTEVVDPLVQEYQQWQSLVDRANLAMRQDRLDEALDLYRQSLQFKPDHQDVRLKIAQIYLKQEEYEKAAQAFKETIAIAPDHVEARNYLGYVYE